MENLKEDLLPDALDDPDLADDPFFKNADFCWIIKDRRCILPVRHQGRTYMCYAFVLTATMNAEEVLKRGCSSLGSTQEFLDYMHLYKRPKTAESATGPFKVPSEGFANNYPDAFGYVMKHRLSTDSIYPWIGKNVTGFADGKVWDGEVKVVTRLHDSTGKEVKSERIVLWDEKISINNYIKIDRNRKSIEEQLRKQPLTGRIKYSEDLRDWRGGGIFQGPMGSAVRPNGSAVGGHAITVVGYGGGEGDDAYYICQNSWGRRWGYKGYFKVRRDLITRFFVPVGTCSPKNRQDSTLGTKNESVPEASEAEPMGSRSAKRKREAEVELAKRKSH